LPRSNCYQSPKATGTEFKGNWWWMMADFPRHRKGLKRSLEAMNHIWQVPYHFLLLAEIGKPGKRAHWLGSKRMLKSWLWGLDPSRIFGRIHIADIWKWSGSEEWYCREVIQKWRRMLQCTCIHVFAKFLMSDLYISPSFYFFSFENLFIVSKEKYTMKLKFYDIWFN
jgi:hypothetical protein